MPRAKRRRFVELLRKIELRDKMLVCLLNRTIHGTQDASNLWQLDYTELMKDVDFIGGQASPATLFSVSVCGRRLAHGDDAVLVTNELRSTVVI